MQGEDCDEYCDPGADDVGQGLHAAERDAHVFAVEANEGDREDESDGHAARHQLHDVELDHTQHASARGAERTFAGLLQGVSQTPAMDTMTRTARYLEKLRDVPLNERQRLVINRMLEGFDGKLTTSKWAALTKSSTDTALRDIQQLVERGVLVRNQAGGRSTNDSLSRGLRLPLVVPLWRPKA